MKTNRFHAARLRRVFSVTQGSVGACALLALGLQLECRTAVAGEALDREISVNIPANTLLEDALIEWGSKAGVTVMINTSTLNHQVTKGVRGTLSARSALSLLLRDSGLSYTEEGGRIRVVPATALVRSAQKQEFAELPRLASSSDTSEASINGGSSEEAGENASDAHGDTRRKDIEQVVVTAEKRSERVQDVPIPVTVLNANSLVDANQIRIQDYYSSVPGLTLVAGASPAANQTIAIRGITTGPNTNPTVGVTVDDVPYGSATNLGGGNTFPNIDPGDLARVEVLRGPQGTLYGASSLGGLIKYVTIDPSTDALSGRVQAGTSSVHNGDELGYNFRGSVNVPLSDTLAVRASAFTRRDPGYIDNPTLDLKGLNEGRDSGGRVAVLWRPSQDFSLKLSALYQTYKGDGSAESVLGLPDLQQNFTRGTGLYNGSTQAYSATLTTKLAGIDITSLSGYAVQQADNMEDFSFALGGLAEHLYGASGVGLEFNNRTSRFTQEIRFSSSIGKTFDWLFGVFYTHEYSPYIQSAPIIDPSGSVVAIGYDAAYPSTYREYAAFADLTLHVTDQFDIQVGGRESDIKQVFEATTIYEPVLNGGSNAPVFGMRDESSAKPFTYLVTPRFKISPDLMVYVRAASGYRVGGPNVGACTVNNFPCQYDPDKTHDYELGVKGDALQRMFSYDVSLYYVDWKDIQLSVTPPTSFTYTTNAGEAKSQGVELSLEMRPLAGMTIGAWVAWGDAELTKAFPSGPLYGGSGDQLPFSSRFSGNVSFNDDFPIAGHVTGFVGATASYIGDRTGSFTSTAALQREEFPAYAKVDLRTGVHYDSWTIDVFLDNATDRRGSLNGSPATDTVVFIQPRTVGLNVSKSF